jgi:outer membrane lipoprotein carrier protein
MKLSWIARTVGVVLCLATPAAVFSANAGVAVSQQGAWTLDGVLKQLDAQAAEFHSLTADLERTKVTVVVNDKSTESGKILVRRDDKMRIDLTQPDPRTILRDGDNFYIYNPKIHRVEEYHLGKKKSVVDQFLLLGFGTSGTLLKQSYTIALQGEVMLDNRKMILLELTPTTD